MTVKRRIAAALICTVLLGSLLQPGAIAPAAADGTPDIALTASMPASGLLGASVPVTLTLTNPSGPDGFNATFTDTLPAGVSYVGGSSSPEPLVLPQGDGTTVLVWKNVADSLTGTTVTIDYSITTDASFDIEDVVTNGATVHANSDPRVTPSFDPETGAITGGFTSSASAAASTTLIPFTVEKTEPSAESELLRGVHDHQTVYTIEIENNTVNPTNTFSIVDFLPAGLEFLGCGGVDNSSGGDEYTSSGPINPGNEPTIVNPCLTPSSVTTTTTDPDGAGPLPSGVYTRVEWDAASLATNLLAGESFVMDYVAAIPLRENIDTVLANPTANLDNNTGPLTTESEAQLQNLVTASGFYNGRVAASTATDIEEVIAEDLSIHKTVDSPTFAQGDTPVFSLVIETSEYAVSTGTMTVTDTLPATLDFVSASTPVDGTTLNADGTLTLQWDLAGAGGANHVNTLTINTAVRDTHRQGDGSGGAPVASNDEHVNVTDVAADVTVVSASDGSTSVVSLVDESSATQTSEGPSILKEVSEPGAGILTCGDGSGLTFNPTTAGQYRPGDRVCFRLSADFPSNMDTLSPVISDLLPTGFSLESWAAGAGSDIASGAMTFTDGDPFLEWSFADQDTGGVTIEIVLSTTIDDPLAAASGESVENLMKFRYLNENDEVYQLRDLANASWGEANLSLSKGILDINDSAVSGAPADEVAAQEGDVVTYELDVVNNGSQIALDASIRDVLPEGIACTDVAAISDGGACDGANDWIQWDAADDLDINGGASLQLTYDVTIPVGVSAGASLINTAGVRNYGGETNTGSPFTYVPGDNIDPTLTSNTDPADDDAEVTTALPTLDKSRDTGVTADAGNPNNRATIGETVSYDLELDLPSGTTFYAATLTDFLPAGMDLDSGSASALLDGAALPAGFSFTVDDAGNSVTVDFPDPYTTPAGANETLSVTFDAVVLDTATNVRDFANPNSADFDFENVAGDSRNVGDTINTRIVEPNIIVAKSHDDGDGVVTAGQTLTYTVTATNDDDGIDEVSVAHNTIVVDEVPAELVVLEATGDPAEDGDTIAPDGGTWDEGARTITWSVAEIDPGATASRSYQVETANPLVAAGSLVNTVTAVTTSLAGTPTIERSSASDQGDEVGDGYLANGSSTVTVPVLGVAKSAAPATATIGEPVTYTVDLTIPGGVVAYDVTVLDDLPDGIDFESLTSVVCDEGGSTCSPDLATGDVSVIEGGGDVAFFFGDLTSAATGERVVTITYVGVVDDVGAADAGATLTNEAQVLWNGADTITSTPGTPPSAGSFDATSAVSTASITSIEPQLTIDKDVAGQSGDDDERRALPGETLDYTITVTNVGNSPAHDVTVTDVVSDTSWAFTDTSSAAGVTNTDADPVGGLEWTIDGPIAASGQISITYQLVVPPGFDSADEVVGSAEQLNTADAPSYFGLGEATRLANPTRPSREYDDVVPDTVDIELDLASIGDRVWFDVDADGVQGASEPGLADLTVTVTWLGGNGLPGGGDDEVFTTTTDADGLWVIDQLPGGEYVVAVDEADPDFLVGLEPSYDLDGTTLTPNGSWSGSLGDSDDLRTVDFGYTGTGTIGDTIWLDQDRDGAVDATESGLQGVDVTVTWFGLDGVAGGGDDIIYSDTTDSNGEYLVENLPPGSYQVEVDTGTIPGGYQNVSEPGVENDSVATLTLGVGADDLGQDFGYAGSGSIGDTIWLDQNGDAAQSGDEPGLGGVAVELTYFGPDGVAGGADDSVFTTVTDSTGGYIFEDLPPGNYQVEVTGSLPPNVTNSHDPDTGTAGDSVSTLTLADGEDNVDQDFGYESSSVLGDRVWWDRDLDGVQEVGEPGLGGIEVTATYLGPDGTLGTVDDEIFVTTTTADGDYLFEDVTDGDYVVAVTGGVPTGFTITFDEDSGTTAPDATTALALSDEHLTADFGYAGSGSIGDTVWFDRDLDGTLNGDEVGLAGIEVSLTWFGPDGVAGGADDIVLTTTTAADGSYLFPNLPAGEFAVAVNEATLPAGMQPTYDEDGGTATPDSSTPVSLAVGQNVDSVDFGYAGSGSIGDTVWLDGNADGVLDEDEAGIGGVTVELVWTSPQGPVTMTTTTDSSGNWSFPNLPPGDYDVTVLTGTLPAGLSPTYDADSGLDSTSTLTLGDGEQNDAQDFGYEGAASIGDLIWLDLDGDGFVGADEPGIANQLVQLDWDGPTGPVSFTTRTDEDGNYLFEGLPDGDYSVTVVGGIVDAATNTGDPGADADSTNSLTIAGGVSNLDQDFGYQGSNGIGDLVWLDRNRDGIVGPTESAIESAELTIVWLGPDGEEGTADDVVLPVLLTDIDGGYEASGLPDGSWSVSVTGGLPDGIDAPTYDADDGTTEPDAHSIVTDLGVGEAAGVVDLDQDFGFTGTGSIGDTVWINLNGNAVQDPDEPGLGGLTVRLTELGPDGVAGTADDVDFGTTVTAEDGTYLFEHLPPGTYAVDSSEDDLPDGYVPDVDLDGGDLTSATMTLAAGEAQLDVDFAVRGDATLSGTIHVDTDRDGVVDPDEERLDGVTVVITWIGPEGPVEVSVATDADGTWSLDNMPPGEYTVEVDTSTVPEDLVPTIPTVTELAIAPGATAVAANAFIPAGSIGDLVWNDANANGEVDDGEAGVEGVVVVLTSDGRVIATAVTDADGAYLFEGLPPGDYLVDVDESTFPDGLRLVSSANTSNGSLVAVTLSVDEDWLQVDFGLASPPSALALTGSSTLDLIIVAVVLFLAGVALVVASRRKRPIEVVVNSVP
jgi:fimbrial isopeptide formation D2 family protein/uncharacterized repeat protein (TIGR01451 family)